jgi:hypothetical protein
MTVYANGLEVACKKQSNRIIANFPDVCFTPPENPATPPGVPVPYPSFGLDSDTEKGTGTVFVRGETVTQRNLSYYSRTTGTEAGCAQKKGIISSNNTGKEYANAWSGNVKMDGEPISRFGDIGTHNHSSPATNTRPQPRVGGANPAPPPDKCQLTTYADDNCPPGETPHHLVGDAQFHPAGSNDFLPGVGEAFKASTGRNPNEAASTTARAFHGAGLCICLQGMVKESMKSDQELSEMFDLSRDQNIPAPGGMGDRRLNQDIINATRQNVGRTRTMFPNWAGPSPYSNTLGQHGLFHDQYDNIIEAQGATNGDNTVSLEQSAQTAADIAERAYGCDAKAVKEQILAHYQAMGIPPDTRLRSGIVTSRRSQPPAGTRLGIP